MTDHTCNSQDLSKIRNMADIANVRSRFHDDFIRSFARIISDPGSEHMFLTAEVLASPCSAPGQDHKTILSKEELLDFLDSTKSTFGAFQVELEDGYLSGYSISLNYMLLTTTVSFTHGR